MEIPKHFKDLLEANYPVPDPAWDYAGVWHSAQQAKQQLETAIKYMSDIEKATSQSDKKLIEQLEAVQTQIKGALALLHT